MTTTREQVCAEARSWIGTPWIHQGHRKGVGVDCGGLIGGVALALGLVERDFWTNTFAPFAGYARNPNGDSLARVLDAFMSRIDPDDAGPGDVAAFRFRSDPRHVGFLVPYGGGGLALVHSTNGGERKVVEHRLDDRWRERIVLAYALPGVH